MAQPALRVYQEMSGRSAHALSKGADNGPTSVMLYVLYMYTYIYIYTRERERERERLFMP